ncbi:uncharacterized protein LOC143179704 [Calliopsis andreniformis]|uniref:uncharacterized protein LOC143179704 n=1 Tax=Calliopsis andreniformis TaxID=337506 RepID=UPI003FCC4563
MHFSISCWTIVLALCVSAFGYKLDNYVDVREIDKNTLSPMDQLPPEDPAQHSFPTVPTVPLIPVCAKEGYFRDPFNCRKFYFCRYPDDIPAGFYCQSNLIFNAASNSCDQPEHVEC